MGKEVLVLCRDIIAPWGQKRAPAAPRTPRRPLLRLEWPPRIGDVVQIKGAGKLEWIVTGITGDSYELETDVFTRRQRRTEPLENLEPSNSSQGAERVAPDELIEQVLPPSAVEEEGDGEVQSFAAVEASGEGALTGIVDSLWFSLSCLDQYQRLFARKLSGEQLSASLRRTLLQDGELVRRRHGAPGAKDEYLRIRVPRRFDIILRKSPSAGEGVMVERLIDKRRRPRRRAA